MQKEIVLYDSNDFYGQDDCFDLDLLYFEDMKEQLKDEVWIMQGNVGRWNGNFDAGAIIYDIEDFFYKIGDDINDWFISAKRKIVTIRASHHDGVNIYKLKALNQAGIDLAAEYEDSYYCGFEESDRKFHAKLFNSRKYIADLKIFG